MIHCCRSYLISLFLVCSISACSNNGSSEEPAGNIALDDGIMTSIEDPVEKLSGTWVTECSSESIGTTREYTEWELGTDEVVTSTYWYEPEDIECVSPQIMFKTTYAVTYLPESLNTPLGAATKVDLLPVAYSDSDGYNSGIDGIPVDVENAFLIFLAVDGKLYGGDITTGDGSSSDKRPTELSVEDFLVRK